jgi:inhibitor of cysteine peptidase
MKIVALFCGFFVSVSVVSAAESKPLTVGVGEEFKITLESNPSTGNQWLVARPLDDRLLKLLGSEYKRGRAGAPGGGGNEILSFKALNEGKTQIHLKYARLWEHDVAPSRTTNFVVVITRAGSAPH